MADGSIKIDVGMDTSKARKQLDSLNQKVSKLEAELSNRGAEKSAIEEKLTKAQEEAERTKIYIEDLKGAIQEMEASLRGEKGSIEYDPLEFQELPNYIAKTKQDLSEAEKTLKEQEKTVASLTGQYEKMSENVSSGSKKLEEMKEAAGQLERVASQTDIGSSISSSLDSAKKKLLTFMKYAIGIRSVYFLFRRLRAAIASSVTEFAKADPETQKTINDLKASLAQLQVSWGSAFAPILNAVAPLLQTLIGWLTSAANAVARFLAIISGKPTYKRAVSNNNALASSVEGVGAAAEEAKKQLMSFDELNILSDNRSNGGGGSGGAGSGVEMIEEAVDAFDGSFLSNLALSVKDVLFTWEDLNPEQIAEKVIAGLGLALGAALGITLGLGAGGVLLMTLGGLVFGLLIDSMIFDHDGVLSREEILRMIALALGGLAGGIIGFTVGGFPGALLGAALGMGITMLIMGTTFSGNNKETKESWLDKLRRFLHFPSDDEIVYFFKKTVWEDGILAFFAELLTLVTGQDFTTATEAGESMADRLVEGMALIGEKLQTWWDEKVKPWFTADKWKELGQTAMQSIRDGLNSISLPKFHFSWETTGYTASFFGRQFTVNIPFPHLDWYARGGVFDAASIIGVGENGKEAVVPLEKNTEWINLVVDGVINRLKSDAVSNAIADAFMSTPLPAIAGGGVIPPNSAYAGAGGEWGNSLMEEIKALRSEISALASQPIQINSKLYMDRREVGRGITEFQRDEQRARGY